MTIALPGSSKKGIGGLFGRKSKSEKKAPTAEKQLTPEQVAKMFNKDAAAARAAKPTKLNDVEKRDQERLGSLRGALYSKD
ncbi:hypothetical protein [Loktanella sp. S4079]|uniref:hypothetical protein n=1 Tax=Loktanella sp. S4079 TaxID=579483 RepID=UPI0005FA4FED|nr:hypothetical protein [Loktanella sp. S4079]KJZ20058.1 hypothetical protein TW80_04230 [Loktanella sp. S4079]